MPQKVDYTKPKVKEEKKEDTEMKDESDKPKGPVFDSSGKMLKAPKEAPKDDGKIRDSKG